MTWLPINGWAAEELRHSLNGKGDPINLVQVKPRRDLSPHEALTLAAHLSRDYDAVAFIVNAVMVEAARNYKIKNFRKEGITFAQWLCPEFFEDGRKVRWCLVG